MTTDMNVIKKELVGISKDISYIKKALDGNGEPGLIHNTRVNSDFRIASETKNKMTQYAIGSGWVLVVLIIILNISGVI